MPLPHRALDRAGPLCHWRNNIRLATVDATGTSENNYSTHYGAYCWQQQVQVQEGGSMPTRDKRLLTDLRCRKHDHPFKAEIWQRLHYVAHSNEIVGKTTTKGALDNVRCPICGSPAKEP